MTDTFIASRMRSARLCALALILTGIHAKADVVFSDFGPGNTYSCCFGWQASGASSPLGVTESAGSFTPLSNAALGN
jgi:hypothetical protein